MDLCGVGKAEPAGESGSVRGLVEISVLLDGNALRRKNPWFTRGPPVPYEHNLTDTNRVEISLCNGTSS